MDRMIGLLGLIFVSGILITWRWDWLTQGQAIPHFQFSWLFSASSMRTWLGEIPDTTKLLYILLAVLGASILGVATSFVITGFGLVDKLPAPFPEAGYFRRSLDGLQRLRARLEVVARWRSLPPSACIIASFMVFFCAARSLLGADHVHRSRLRDADREHASPRCPSASAAPGRARACFRRCSASSAGCTPAQSIAISLTGFVLVLFWGMVGGIIYAFYRPSEHAKIREIEREVHRVEHEVAETE